MGGAAAGEVASAMAADIISRHLLEAWTEVEDTSPEHFAEHLRDAVEHANDELHTYAQDHPEVRGMGTTATVAGLFEGALYLAQVGDSRAYLIRQGVAMQLTKDQSLTQRLVDAGEMTEEEAEKSTRRNIILQALGPDPRVKVDLTFLPLCRDDVILICSDGLSGQVRREEMAALASGEVDPAAVCAALIELANSRGGPDNITVVVTRLHGDGLPTPDSAIAADYLPTPIMEEDSDELPVTTQPIRSTQPIPALTREAAEAALADIPVAPPALRSRTTPALFAVIGIGVLGLLGLLFWLLPRLMP
jgi:protein phosphatase